MLSGQIGPAPQFDRNAARTQIFGFGQIGSDMNAYRVVCTLTGFCCYWRWKSRPLRSRSRFGARAYSCELLKRRFEVVQSSAAKYIVKQRGPPSQCCDLETVRIVAEIGAGTGHDDRRNAGDLVLAALPDPG